MRRFLSLLLVLCLLAAPALTPAALAEDEAAPLPAVGDVVCGFEAVETRDYAMLDAVVVRFQHQKTGAELYYIANDDTNRAFNLVIYRS